ncbi:uncharacterized protein Tco025E_00961 [Trypanosoma conorhini]|uniref:Uncharacterized protein n=1 Tax=Trypanosoma conorhini TaxID=83891 RepID=A0A422QA26_9TRYP|nr:uncharacterized protein Tco025E_00961 [Trypanosoma conorhini]RNF26805.1 hypothetical protein Tco025E_00961 [Trypanosoma conorhini]
MAAEWVGSGKTACHLILLCSESPLFDLHVLAAILAHGLTLALPPPPSEAADAASPSPSPSPSAGEHDAEKGLVDAVLAALQASVGGSPDLGATASSAAVPSPVAGAKGGKASKGAKKAMAAAAAATSASGGAGSPAEVSKSLTGDGTQRSRGGWYSVVEGPQWEAPVVFIHQLSELERCEGGEATGSTHTSPREGPADVTAMVQRALRLIAEEMEAPTSASKDACAGALPSDGGAPGEQPQRGPQPSERPQVHSREIPVVLALHDYRALPALMARRTSPTNPIDIRLIVQFVDGRPAGVAGAAGVGGPSGRSRAAASGKRRASREGPNSGLTAGANDADGGNAPTDAVNTLEAWIERQQREGAIKVVTSPAGGALGSGVVCLRDVFEDGGDDKAVWVRHCVHTVLPTMQHVVRDIARYAELIAAKKVYRLPSSRATPPPRMGFPTPQEENSVVNEATVEPSVMLRTREHTSTAFPSLASAVLTTATWTKTLGLDEGASKRLLTSDTTPLPWSTASFLRGEEEKWSYYVRERKVRGQWTCLSAACALAAQVTVSLARRQQPRVVCPAEEEEEGNTTLLEVMNEQDGASPAGNVNDGTGTSLLRQLRQYASKRTVLGQLDMNTEAETAAAQATAEEAGKPIPPVEAPGRASPLLFPAPGELEQTQFNTTATLPMDHTMDRPTNPPSPEEIRWVTQQFVKRGIGAVVTPPVEALRDDSPLMLSPEQLRAAMKLQGLLEETLNGYALGDGEDAMDAHLLQLIEEDFRRASETIDCGWTQVWDDITVAVGLTPLDEKFQRSVERRLTARERRHILQQTYLMQLAEQAQMTGMAGTANAAFASTRGEWMALMHPTARTEAVGPRLWSVEECMTMPVAVRRMYEFQSRFGSHLCRLVRCPIPDPLEALDGNLTALYSIHAENVHSRKRVRAMMLGGVPIPLERQARRVWCHYVAGVPTLDQLNELSASQAAAETHAASPSAAPACGPAAKTTSTTAFGVCIGELLRQQLLRRLQRAPQLLLLTPLERKGRTGGVCRSEGELQTVLEGRHALYPFENSVVEVVTTDRGRMCRYVKPSELTCTLHYGIAPPSPQPSAATGSVAGGNAGASAVTSPHLARKPPCDEVVYFTTTFDDGVVLTCSPHWATPAEPVNSGVAAEKEPVANTSATSMKSATPRRGRAANRGAKRGANTSTVLADDNHAGGRRGAGAGRHSRRGGGDDADSRTAAPERSLRVEEATRVFPVAPEGSVLLWTAGPEVASSEDANANAPAAAPAAAGAGEPRKIPSLAVTVAANGVTLHCEEEEGVLWITQHESRDCPAAELLRCVHAYDARAQWQEAVEVEVCRAVLEEEGAVCRYFHSGVTQMLYPDGAVVTRYPAPATAAVGTPPVICETLLMATGLCYVRQLCEGNASPFVQVAGNTLETRVAYDRGHHCRIVSRADGVMVVYYYYYLYRNPDEANGQQRQKQQEGEGASGGDGRGEGRHLNADHAATHRQNRAEGEEEEEDGFAWGEGDPAPCDTDVIARVTLHADGTCITTFSARVSHESCSNPPAPLKTLLEQVGVVGAACGATVQYCVEAPSLPRVFVCASVRDDAWTATEGPRDGTLQGTDAQNAFTAALHDLFFDKCDNMPKFATSPLSLTEHPFPSLAAGTRESPARPITRRRPYDRFYVVFGDGSVLRRRVIYRGMRGNSIPFLETLFTRSTATSVRVIHESGLAVVEPAEVVRRSTGATASLAIGEGFAMFDVAQGGLRLVDHQHYLTEVHDLYSPGPVRAGMKSATLEGLLRQLVLPTYTPHTVTKARQEAMRQEEVTADARTRRNRATGVCAALTTRLRELAEGFVIAHNLLRTDILNTAKRQWEAGTLGMTGKKYACEAASEASWGNLPSGLSNASSKALKALVSPAAPAIVAPPMGVLPILFSELENDIVVQHLHPREVEEYVRAREAEPIPVFLAQSTSAGEPDVRQLTFFRSEVNARTAEEPGPVGSATAAFFLSGRVSSGQLHTSNGLRFGQSDTVVTGSLLGGAVQRQERLALFSGRRLAFPTTQWFPQTLQPPRRLLRPCPDALGSGGRTGGVVLLDDDAAVAGNGGGGAGQALSSYERLRIFFKFSEFAPTTQQAVLAGEVRRREQLVSMLMYHKAMNALTPEMPYETSAEQRRLREKYLAATT